MDPDVQLGPLVDHRNPEELAVARDARRRLDAALESLDAEKRAILTMFEIDGIGCAAIAEMLGVPKGTVFSRLSAARQAFQASLARQDARDSSPARASGGHR
jgi:RNA polymerase sigma-70 factor (ECF subfamily)